jgi:hypothetical protein
MKLFSYCPEISAEYGNIFGSLIPSVDLKNLEAFYDKKRGETWLRFCAGRETLRNRGLSAPKFIAQIKTARSGFVEVRSDAKELRTFESEKPRKIRRGGTAFTALQGDILDLNLFAQFGDTQDLQYSTALQTSLPLRMPQMVVSYTLLFWLGSLVRYDPHSVYELMDSAYWVLIDGFMTQSRVWLLELFQWALYRKEITLHTAR